MTRKLGHLEQQFNKGFLNIANFLNIYLCIYFVSMSTSPGPNMIILGLLMQILRLVRACNHAEEIMCPLEYMTLLQIRMCAFIWLIRIVFTPCDCGCAQYFSRLF